MSKLHCANCGRPWTATDGDNGCCWNESICAFAIAGRRSPPAPAIDVEAVVAALWDDVTDRRGIKHEFNQCDADVKDEIRAAWSKIIRAALGGKEQQ